ncbi:MAG: carbohydrate kinase family protein [Erysipelotrichaceae bacterium]|nr:carbohydrate kinase family protein [Erysipelotrichaceae bacterium]
MNNKEFDVVAAGIATWDTLLNGIDMDLMQVDSVQCESFSGASGGDAVNGAVNLARLGMKVTLCACIGRDSEGQSIIEELKEAGVNTDNVTYDEKHHTASPVLLIDRKGDRHIIRVPDNANMYFTDTMVSDEVLKSARHLHFASANVLGSMDGEPLGRLFKRAHELGLTTSLDASYDRKGNWMKNIETALHNCDIFIPSYQEARIYAGSDDVDDIMKFFSKYPLKVLSIKLGEKGVAVTDFRDKYHVDTLLEGEVVDTTGAGDAFIAGFVAAWLRGYDLYSSAVLGSAQSAAILKCIGANRGAGTFEQALKLIERKNKKLTMR